MDWRRDTEFVDGTPAEIRASMMPADKDLRAAVCIDEDDVYGELKDAPAVYTYWKMLEEQHRTHVKIIKQRLDNTRERLYLHYTAEEGKTTVKVLDAKVASTKSVIDLEQELLSADRDLKYTSAVVLGIEKKIDCLRSMNSQLRTEQELSKSAQ